jgi:hypothetical protein
MRDGIYYGTMRKRASWRTIVYEYAAGECTYSQTGAVAYTSRRDCAISARQLAEDVGKLYVRPVDAIDDDTRKLARPVPVEPVLFELRADARPASARNPADRLQQPGLFDL